MNQRIRVVVANQPRLMRELVLATILEQTDIEVIAEIQDEAEIANIVDGTNPDFLIVALNEFDERPPFCDALLRNHPEMKILALAPERNVSMFFWASFRIHEVSVESSESGLLNTIRTKAQVAGG